MAFRAWPCKHKYYVKEMILLLSNIILRNNCLRFLWNEYCYLSINCLDLIWSYSFWQRNPIWTVELNYVNTNWSFLISDHQQCRFLQARFTLGTYYKYLHPAGNSWSTKAYTERLILTCRLQALITADLSLYQSQSYQEQTCVCIHHS